MVDVTRQITLLSLMAIIITFLICDTTVVMAAQNSTGSNHTMTQNGTISMVQNSTNSSAVMSHNTNETLGVNETVVVAKNTAVPDPPLRQLKNGVSVHDVKCIDGMQLILKKEDGSPACVKPEDATTLTERGWAQTP